MTNFNDLVYLSVSICDLFQLCKVPLSILDGKLLLLPSEITVRPPNNSNVICQEGFLRHTNIAY